MKSNIYPTLLLSGTATGLRISYVATGAFFDNAPAELMTEIAKYPSVWIDIMDGTALLRGYTGAAAVGTGETLGAELVVNGTFDADTDWINGVNTTIHDGAAYLADTKYVARSIEQAIGHTVGNLYYITYDCTKTSGNGGLIIGEAPWIEASNGARAGYRTAKGVANLFFSSYSFNGTLDNISVKQVTAPSTSGCLLFNSRAMTTQSLLVNTFAAANYNKSSYTYKLWGNFKTSGNKGYVR